MGSGAKVEDINKLLKQHRQIADMMKAIGTTKRGGALGKMASMLGLPGGGFGGGIPQPSTEQLAALQRNMGNKQLGPTLGQGTQIKSGQKPPGGVPEAPKLPGLGGASLPGLGGGLLNGLNTFGKKK
jgi:signal recognition particle subunit SRP54